jgi:predicted outer membrane repeat protein
MLSIAASILTLGRCLALDQMVTDAGDDGGSDQLRAKLDMLQSSGGGTLTFDVGTTTIVLNGVLPEITIAKITVDGGNLVTLSGADSSRIFSVNAGATLSLRNIILTNGYSSDELGGAIHNRGILDIDNCKFFENKTGLDFAGGAIASEGLLYISGSEFGSNAAGSGGALYLSSGTVTTIADSQFHDNTALHTTGWGGAILSWHDAQVTIDASTFTQNSAQAGGGFASAGPSILNNCSFSGNVASSDVGFNSGYGGGIHVSAFTLTMNGGTVSNNAARLGGGISNAAHLIVNRVTFRHNTATESGGGVNTIAPAELNDVTFQENTAPFGGGAACRSPTFSPPSNGGPLTIQNATFSGNSAESGGGLFVSFGSSNLTNATFSGNTASLHGGAIYNANPLAPSTRLKNTLITNSGTGGNCFDESLPSGVIGSNGFNLSDDSTCAPYLNQPSDRNAIPAQLGPLDSNGGPTQTHLPLAGSPAIDSATSEDAPARDQRGYLRAGAAPDIGAAEYGGTIPVTLANISTRLNVGTGDNASIGGFIVTGTHDKLLMVRGIGPSLPVEGALANPTLELRNAAGELIASNDDWQTNANAADIQNTGIAPTNPAEAALLGALAPAAYTAILRGANDTTGTGLVEVYDLDRTADSKLANISTRGVVRTGNDVLIGGFIVVGPDPQRAIVRAIGPSLPLAGALADPTLGLFDGNGSLIGFNNNWGTDQEAEIIATGVPPSSILESAIVATLNPGAYTAVVRGVGSATGSALVEVYGLE